MDRPVQGLGAGTALSTQLEHILQTAKPGAADATVTAVRSPPRIGPKPAAPNHTMLIGGALVILLLASRRAVLYLKPKPHRRMLHPSVAVQTPAPAPIVQTPTPAPTPEAAAAPVAKPVVPRPTPVKKSSWRPPRRQFNHHPFNQHPRPQQHRHRPRPPPPNSMKPPGKLRSPPTAAPVSADYMKSFSTGSPCPGSRALPPT